MKSIGRLALLSMTMLIWTVSAAEARKARIPIIVPGFSSGEILEKVLDLPDIPALRRNDGTHIDLGYLHKRGGGGEWVGHVGSSRQYLRLTSDQLKTLLDVAGVARLPPEPIRPSGGGGMFWIVIIGLVLLAGAFRLLKKVGKSALPATAAVQTQHSDSGDHPRAWSRADEAVARAAANATADAPSPEPAKTRSTVSTRVSRQPQTTFGRARGATPAFGRR